MTRRTGAVPPTGRCLARALAATAVAAFAAGVVPVSDVAEDPREGPPGRPPPPPMSTSVVVRRWIAVAIIGSEAVLALALEEGGPGVVIIGGPARVVALLRHQLAPKMVVDGDGARRPCWHRRDRQAATAERPSPRQRISGGKG
jgi:hypothetical protein